VVACGDGRLRFFEPLGSSAAHDEKSIFATQLIAYDPSNTVVLAIGTRGKSAVRLMFLGAEATVREEIFHSSDLTGGSFDPTGRLALTTSKDRSVYVRESTSGEPVARRGDFASTVTCAAFSADDGDLRIINGCEDGRIFVWPVDPTPAARARQPRGLWDWEFAREQRLAAPLPFR
jgi:WD40 repeat protein